MVALEQQRIGHPATVEPVRAPSAAHKEAVEGFDHFKSVQKAISPDYKVSLTSLTIDNPSANFKPAAFNGFRMRSEARKPSADAQPGVIDPGDDHRFKTPVFEGKREPDERPMDEHGRRDGDYDGRNPDLATDQVHSKLGKDGKLKSISSTEALDQADEKTTFDFDDNGKIKSRTIDDPSGKEVVQYNADGTPKSRRTTKPGSHKEEVGRVYPQDTVHVKDDAQGKPVSLTSVSGDSTSKFSFDEKGKVTARSIEVPSQSYQVQFDGAGRAKAEVIEDRDGQGNTTEITTKDNDMTRVESYAVNGKLKSVEEWGASGDYHSLAENLADGSTRFEMDKDGVETVTVNRPDGTKIEDKNFVNMRTNIKTVTNPDGSSFGTANTPDGTTTFRKGADGFWDAIVHYRRTGMESYIHGGPKDDFVDKLMDGPIVSAPI